MGDGGAFGEVTPVDASVGWAAGSGYSTAGELAVFYEAMLAGALYPTALVEEQLSAVEADLGFDEEGLETGYGLGVMFVGIDEQLLTGHLGSVEGFFSAAMRDEDTGALAVVLSNASEQVVVEPTMRALGVASR